jgi:hypothetical protein
MPHTARVVALFLVVTLMPVPASAWGAAAHRYIMRRAIESLPPELAPLFKQHEAEIVLRVNDPDTWRVIGWPDNPSHFLDFGVPEYGEAPFTALPRDYGEALAKFGRETLERNGTLPWRAAEIAGQLRRAFEAFRRRNPYTVSDVVLLSAVGAHYLQDAHQPFHATNNHDGQLTGQRGLHSRFERDLFERYEAQLKLPPPRPAPIRNVRDAAFDILLRSHAQVDAVLEADRAASKGRTAYDDAYYAALFAAVRPTLERALSESIAATAGLIIGAWEEAGRPAIRVRDVRPTDRVSPQE